MKFKKLLLLAGLALLSQTAYANIIVNTLVPGADTCGVLNGTWKGGSTVKADGIISCHYSGTAIVTPAFDKINYIVAIDMSLDSGLFCKTKVTFSLPGYCENNAFVLATDDANLTGTVNDTGTASDLSGYVYVDVLGSHIKADVSDTHLDKQSK